MQVEPIRKSGKTQEVMLTNTALTTGLQNEAEPFAKLNIPLFTNSCTKQWRREKVELELSFQQNKTFWKVGQATGWTSISGEFTDVSKTHIARRKRVNFS